MFYQRKKFFEQDIRYGEKGENNFIDLFYLNIRELNWPSGKNYKGDYVFEKKQGYGVFT